MKRILLAVLGYFATVFLAGFILGVIRTLWLAPAWGERNAELLEMPFMLLICLAFASLLRRKFDLGIRSWLLVGCLALAMLLSVEFTLVLALRGLSLDEYLASRDPLALGAYLASLLLYAMFPALLAWRAKHRTLRQNGRA